MRQAGLTPLEALRADPSADIRNTQTVRHLIRGGTVRVRAEPCEPPQGATPPPE